MPTCAQVYNEFFFLQNLKNYQRDPRNNVPSALPFKELRAMVSRVIKNTVLAVVIKTLQRRWKHSKERKLTRIKFEK